MRRDGALGWWRGRTARRARTQVPLFLLLCGFTAVNLIPIVWAVLTSF